MKTLWLFLYSLCFAKRWPEDELVAKLLENYDPDVAPFAFNLTQWRQGDFESLEMTEESGSCYEWDYSKSYQIGLSMIVQTLLSIDMKSEEMIMSGYKL